MIKFEIGKRYTSRFATDSDATLEIEVVARTSKQITIVNPIARELKKVGIKIDDKGNEMAYPLGKYSMAPIIRADRFN